ncbi:hypothetical protein MSG28_005597 [Choristoneura fumiferana]|uniref:Uncharacterized protein n=1 Tax=Choristoneura fumiferana TaxID=7141 RepID=A0ACC0L021_CHOFU|nr:hypothetical protein MSG28_005597 [Choristoneura fumiferana]
MRFVRHESPAAETPPPSDMLPQQRGKPPLSPHESAPWRPDQGVAAWRASNVNGTREELYLPGIQKTAAMSVIIRLQNLPWSANALDIRNYFRGLSIPEGGVHIVGGELGDAFIAFSSAALQQLYSHRLAYIFYVTSELTSMPKVLCNNCEVHPET